MPVITEKPIKEISDFLGFFDSPTAGIKYYNADLSSAKIWNTASGATLYAQWKYKTDFASGTGTQENPFTINTAEQLRAFAEHVNFGETYSDTYFELGGNINLNDAEWTPIGTNSSYYFAGNLNGKGHTISNFKITASKGYVYVGLLGINYGILKNLGVENFTINIWPAGGLAGGLVGYNYYGVIENCYSACNITATTSSTSYMGVGGLVGHNYNGIITKSYATGNISVTTDVYASNDAGGLVALNDNGTITRSYSTGNVKGVSRSNTVRAGGLVALNRNSIITDCYATGNVSATASYAVAYAGGLIAIDKNDSAVTNCYAKGAVIVEVTGIKTSYDAYAGELLGYVNSGVVITSCYSTGDISTITVAGIAYAGGFVGDNNGGILINCYRYFGQKFYRKRGSSTYSTSSNTEGTVCSLEQINNTVSPSFYTSTLGWDHIIWDFSDLDLIEGKLSKLI